MYVCLSVLFALDSHETLVSCLITPAKTSGDFFFHERGSRKTNQWRLKTNNWSFFSMDGGMENCSGLHLNKVDSKDNSYDGIDRG